MEIIGSYFGQDHIIKLTGLAYNQVLILLFTGL